MGTPPGPGGPGDQVLVPDSSRGPGIRDPRMGSETPFRAPPPPGEGPRGVVLHQPLAAGPRGTGAPDPSGVPKPHFSPFFPKNGQMWVNTRIFPIFD